jgi:hypothetical protein
MPTPIEQINTFLNANPSAQVWVEEALFRGAPSADPWGAVKAAHYKIGLRTTGPLGQPVQQILGPFSAADVPSDSTASMAQLIGVIAAQQQKTIDELNAEITAKAATIVSQAATIEVLESQLEAAQQPVT